VLCDQTPDPLLAQLAYLQVDNTRSGLVRLAQYAKRQSNAKVLAVTGSSGKTSTKEMLRTALMCQGLAYARRGTGNGIRHVAEGLINTPLAAQWSVFECGLGADSAPIRRQSALLQPDVAVVTSIFPAHFAGYSSMQELVRYKLDIAAHLKPDGVLLLDADSPYHALCCDIAAELRVARLLRFGWAASSDIHIESCQLGLDGTRLALRWQGMRYQARVPMIGSHWAGMVAAVAGALAALQVDVQMGLDALSQVKVPGGRGDIVRHRVAGGEIIAFDSHYNANPGSMAADLAAFGQLCALHPMLRPIAVIGEYKELGTLTAQAHRELGELLAQMPFFRILLVGDNHDDTLSALAACPVDVLATVEDALAVLEQICLADDLLFIKGSNANNLVQIAPALATFNR
jgi:UDP-N-acetylmuramoyl-tripeptide--D-alanyl-D-alanine ligase